MGEEEWVQRVLNFDPLTGGFSNAFTPLIGESRPTRKPITMQEIEYILNKLRRDKGYKKSLTEKQSEDMKKGIVVVPDDWLLGLYDSGRWCGEGVSRLFQRMTGVPISGNGKDWTQQMRSKIVDNEIYYDEYFDNEVKTNPPNFSVLVWDYLPYGHVCVVKDNKWISDYITEPRKQPWANALPNFVFVPKGAMSNLNQIPAS